MSVADTRRRLLWHGMLLFLLGLLTGLVLEQFKNVRMGLSAHLEGILNGLFLLALGAVWSEAVLTARSRAAAYWAALYGTYGNWFTTAMAATLGTAALNPIAGAGHGGSPLAEGLVTFGFVTVGLAMITCSMIVLWGLRGRVTP